MKSIIFALALIFLLNGCGTVSELKKIILDNYVLNEKNSEFKSIKDECAKNVFLTVEKRIFLSDSQEVLVVSAINSCFLEKRIENLEQKNNNE